MGKRLVYWVATCLDDKDCYSLIGAHKYEVANQRKGQEARFAKPVKKVIEYSNDLDLFCWLTSEGIGRSNAGKPLVDNRTGCKAKL